MSLLVLGVRGSVSDAVQAQGGKWSVYAGTYVCVSAEVIVAVRRVELPEKKENFISLISEFSL